MKAILITLAICAMGAGVTCAEDSFRPLDAAKLVDAFMSYLLKEDTNIGKDVQAQEKFLAQDLIEKVRSHVAYLDERKKDPLERLTKRYDVNNNLFLNASDIPTEYRIIGLSCTPFLAIVDVQFKWGPKTDFPWLERRVGFVLSFSGQTSKWSVKDIHLWPERGGKASQLSDLLLNVEGH